MINIKLQVFSKKGCVGCHMEVGEFEGQHKGEVDLAKFLAQRVSEALCERASGAKGARFVECSTDSETNKQLRKEFGLDEDSNDKQT